MLMDVILYVILIMVFCLLHQLQKEKYNLGSAVETNSVAC